MYLHPDSIVFSDAGITRASDIRPGTKLVGLDAEHSVSVQMVASWDSQPLVTVRSKHRHLTAGASTKLLMLRRNPVEEYPPRGGWWTEEHPISDLTALCPQGAECSITDCWCLKHKRHFVVLNRLADIQNIEASCGVGREGRPVLTKFESHEDATRARYEHIAHGHVVSPVRTTPHGHEIHITNTNTRARQIHEWGIVPALPGRRFSVERVVGITPGATVGPAIEIRVSEPVVIEAMVVCP